MMKAPFALIFTLAAINQAWSFGNINKLGSSEGGGRSIGEAAPNYQFRMIEPTDGDLKVNRNASTQVKASDIQVFVEKSDIPGYEHQEGKTIPLSETPFYKEKK
jgi:hypothetical protein